MQNENIVLGKTNLPIFYKQIIAKKLGLEPPEFKVAVKRNIRVPMPDGITLRTDHYYPRSHGSYPTILIRSPYYGGRWLRTDLPGLIDVFIARLFAERGYHVVVQTTRGRFDSEGQFEPLIHEAVDGKATTDWLSRQTWFDGKLGMWGGSYVGYTQWVLAAQALPMLKAIVPVATSTTFSGLMFPDGAWSDLPLGFSVAVSMADKYNWSTIASLFLGNPKAMVRILGAAYKYLPSREADTLAVGKLVPFYRKWIDHPRPDDPYWNAIDQSTHLPTINTPVHLITGWYDFCSRGTLNDYAALKAAGHTPYLTVSRNGHDPKMMFTSVKPSLDWFDAQLKGDRGRLRKKPVRIFIMGADEWRELESWPPPARETHYFLHSNHQLSTDGPESNSPPDRYQYDPSDPTPSAGDLSVITPQGPVDNRSLEARPDVVCFTTLPLSRDIEIIGPVRLELYVQSNRPFTDFIGRLCDVYPDGRSFNVCDGLFRVEPGRSEPQSDGSMRIVVGMWATANLFQQGHSIRLQVSSGAHPRWYRNLGTGEPIANATRMVSAAQTVYHDSTHPSALVLPVTEGA